MIFARYVETSSGGLALPKMLSPKLTIFFSASGAKIGFVLSSTFDKLTDFLLNIPLITPYANWSSIAGVIVLRPEERAIFASAKLSLVKVLKPPLARRYKFSIIGCSRLNPAAEE